MRLYNYISDFVGCIIFEKMLTKSVLRRLTERAIHLSIKVFFFERSPPLKMTF